MYKQYIKLCEQYNIDPLEENDNWEDHYNDINKHIDYSGQYP